VLICYEDTLPYLARGLARQGADFLVNVTNDGWFKASPELDQHVIASVFRAVETRKPVLRAANTGISSIISPRGEEVARLRDPATGRDREVAGYLVHAVPLAEPGRKPTAYVRWGDCPAQVSTAVALLLLVFAAERNRAKRGKR
jgi:apolipoprotein N-acyltransferase